MCYGDDLVDHHYEYKGESLQNEINKYEYIGFMYEENDGIKLLRCQIFGNYLPWFDDEVIKDD